jgi:DNA-binding transcriptional LysR family regulator
MFAREDASEARSRMELRHLRYLVAVADAGTFVAAAKELRVAQPALTRQIHDLERELELALFEKGARKATLTKAGEACVRLSRHVLRDTESAIARARLSNEGLAGECRVICGIFPLASGFVGRLVARMKANYPGITLTIEEGQGTDQWDRLANGDGDINLSMGPGHSHPSLHVESQWTDTVGHALLHPDHPMAARRKVTIAELSIFPSLMLDGILGAASFGEAERHYQQMVKKLRRGDAVIDHLPTFNAILAHVRAMRGWTFIPKSMHANFAPLVGVPIADFKLPVKFHRLWRRADDRPVVQTVISELRAMEREDSGNSQETKRPPRDRKSGTPPRLELRHLRSYTQVARYGSFGRAAEALDISQPALSRQMKDLEHDVGVMLFERGTRGVELTPAGRALCDDAAGVLAVVEQINKEAHRAERGSSQRCVIGVVPHPFIDQLVADAVVRSDHLRISTQLLGTPSVPPALEASEIDLGIAFKYPARVPISPRLIHVPLFDDDLSHAMLARGHPLANEKSLSLADLRDVPFLFPGREVFPPVYDVVMHQFGLAGVDPRVDASYEGAITIWTVAAQGLGWAPGLRAQAESPPSGLVSIPLRDFLLPWGGELVYRKDESRASVLAVIDTIVASAKSRYKSTNEPTPTHRAWYLA